MDVDRGGTAGAALGRDEAGVALLMTLLSMTVLMTLGGALILLTITETTLAAAYRDGAETFHAADAAVSRAMTDLAVAGDWNDVLAGRSVSTFTDGPSGGTRALRDGTVVDLDVASHMARCGRPGTCTASDMDAATAERPAGVNNPRWQLYAYGWMRDMMPPGRIASPVYLVVWVGDDAAETDGDPLLDGGGTSNPGDGVLVLRAHAYGLRGARRMVEVTVGRGAAGVRLLAWRELRV